jgi:hypothetical protein
LDPSQGCGGLALARADHLTIDLGHVRDTLEHLELCCGLVEALVARVACEEEGGRRGGVVRVGKW